MEAPSSTVLWHSAVQRASVRSGESAPLWVLWEAHARPGVLGARYLHARTHLLCGRWEEASKELQALLPLLPQLRCALRSFGVSDVAMLQQTVSRQPSARQHNARMRTRLEPLTINRACTWIMEPRPHRVRAGKRDGGADDCAMGEAADLTLAMV